MAVIKFAKSGLFLSCDVKQFIEEADQLDTKLILADFSGRLTRIAQSSTRSSHLKKETDEEPTTITFCKNGPSEIKVCGDQLCWISEESESLAIMNIVTLELADQQVKDADGFFNYEPYVKRIKLEDLGFIEKARLECCTPTYALHILQERALNEAELEQCARFLKVYTETRALVIDLSQKNSPVVKEVSKSN